DIRVRALGRRHHHAHHGRHDVDPAHPARNRAPTGVGAGPPAPRGLVPRLPSRAKGLYGAGRSLGDMLARNGRTAAGRRRPMPDLEFGWFMPTRGDTDDYGEPLKVAAGLDMFDRVAVAAERAGFEYMLI